MKIQKIEVTNFKPVANQEIDIRINRKMNK